MASRAPSPSSATIARTPPAQPPVRGPSSTTTSRLVFCTERRIVALSTGRTVRRSITSQWTPSPASVSAAARHSCKVRIALTSVTSVPSRTTAASPMVPSSPSTSPLSAYRRLCSRKSTGLSSRIAALSSPLASAGVDGQTIFSPGTPCNQLIGTWEWMAPKRPPPPMAERTTSGTLACSLERYQYLAAWLTRLSMVSGRKSPNMISITGRRPAMALPYAAPARASSESGGSNTPRGGGGGVGGGGPGRGLGRVLPARPPGGRDPPARHGDVLAEEDDRVVVLELLVERGADRRAEVHLARHALNSPTAPSGSGNAAAFAASMTCAMFSSTCASTAPSASSVVP